MRVASTVPQQDLVLSALKDFLQKEPSITGAVLFGSRARGTATQRSDYDVELTADPMSALAKAAFVERWLAHKPTLLAMDIVWADEVAGTPLAKAIARDGILIYAH